MRKITNLLFITALSIFMLNSCNLDVDMENHIKDYGIVTIVSSSGDTPSKNYYIATDKNGTIRSEVTSVELKLKDIGKRVIVGFKLYSPKPGALSHSANIVSLNFVEFKPCLIGSEIKNDSEINDKLWSHGQKYNMVQYARDYINFEFETLSNGPKVNGESNLVYDDIKSTETVKRFSWHHHAEGVPRNKVFGCSSFDVSNIIEKSKDYDVIIEYISLESNRKEELKFKITAPTNN